MYHQLNILARHKHARVCRALVGDLPSTRWQELMPTLDILIQNIRRDLLIYQRLYMNWTC